MVSSVAANGTSWQTIAWYRLARLVASSATFQLLVGAADELEALESIHYPETDDRPAYPNQPYGEMVHPRPRAIIQHDTASLRVRGAAVQSGSGTLILSIEATPDGPLLEDQGTNFTETTGQIVDEMIANSGQDAAGESWTYLNLVEVTILAPPQRVPPDEENQDSFHAVMYAISWIG